MPSCKLMQPDEVHSAQLTYSMSKCMLGFLQAVPDRVQVQVCCTHVVWWWCNQQLITAVLLGQP